MDWVLNLIAKVIAAFFAAIVSDKRVEKTEQVIQEIDNAQDANDVGIRTLDGVLGRLRNIQATGTVGEHPVNPNKPR